MCYLSSLPLKKNGRQIFDSSTGVRFSLILCMCSFVVKWVFGCVVKMTDDMKYWWLRIDYEYTKRS